MDSIKAEPKSSQKIQKRSFLSVFKSKKVVVIMIIIVLFIIGGGSYGLWQYKNNRGKTNQPETITVDGKTFQVHYQDGKQIVDVYKTYQQPGSSSTQETIDTTNQKSISELEAKIATGQSISQDYMTLGQLYDVTNNNDKAVENYQKALDTADPKMDGYQAYMDLLQKVIKQRQESNN